MTSPAPGSRKLTPTKTSLLCALLLCASAAHAQPGDLARDTKLFATYRAMLEEDPYQPYALRRLLEVSHVKGGLDGLVNLYEATVEEDAAAVTDWVVLGHLYGAADRHEDAVRAYGAATKLAPRAWRPHRSRARLHRKVEGWDAALESYDAALERVRDRSERATLWQESADAALEGKQLARGLAYFEAMFSAESTKPFLRMEAAATLARRGYPEASLEAWLAVQQRVGRALKHLVVIWRQVATLREELGDLDGAESTWRAGLKALPTSHWARPEFLEGLVSVYRRRDGLPELVEELSAGQGKRDRATQLTLAHLHEEMGRDDLARSWLERALAHNPRDVATRRRLISVLERSGPASELITQHELLVKLSRGEPRHELALAALYFQKEMAPKGFALLERLSRRYRTDPGVHQRVIDLTMRYGGDAERPRIERSYRTLMRLEPREEGHVISLGEYWWSTGDRAKARETWRRLRTMGAGPGTGQLSLAEVLSDHGLVTEAREAFEAALTEAPKSDRIARAYALFLEQQKMPAEALTVWRRILEGEHGASRAAEARRHMVALWQQAGRSKHEERALRARFKGSPPDLAAGYLLVEILLGRRAFDDAQALLERLRTLAPARLETLVALERLYTRRDQLNEAMDVLEELARLDPREAYDYLHRAADLALARGDLERALSTTRRVVALNPADPSAHARVGDLYGRMGRMQQAAKAWRQVLLLDPRNDAVRFKLSELYRNLDQPDRERQELIHIVRESSQPADALKAGRRLLQVAIATSGLRDVEDALRPLAVQRADRSDVYLKLLIDVYVASVRAIRWSDDTRETRDHRLRQLGARSLRPLLEALAGSDVALRARALEITESTRPPGAVPALARLLNASGAVARVAVAGSLGAIGSSSAARALQGLYGSGSGDAQRIAIWALGLASAPEALDALTQIAESRHVGHGILAAWAMGRRADPRAIEPLQRLARSSDARQRRAAVWALAQTAQPAVTTDLGRSLRASDRDERRLASRGLARIGTAAAHRLLVQQLWTSEDAPMGHLGEALTSAADDDWRPEVAAAYAALADHSRGRLTDETGPLLAATMMAPASPTRQLARAEALLPMLRTRLRANLNTEHPGSVNRMLDACLADNGGVRLAPLVPSTADPTRTLELVRALWSEDGDALLDLASGALGVDVQARSLRLLAHLDTGHRPEAMHLATRGLDSPWPEVQAASVALLSGAPSAVEGLLKRLEGWVTGRGRAEAVRLAIAGAIGRLGGEAREPTAATRALRVLLDDPSTRVRLAAIKAAAELDHDDLLEPLVDRISDPVGDVARAAIAAIERSSSPRATPLLHAITSTRAWMPRSPTPDADSETPP